MDKKTQYDKRAVCPRYVLTNVVSTSHYVISEAAWDFLKILFQVDTCEIFWVSFSGIGVFRSFKEQATS